MSSLPVAGLFCPADLVVGAGLVSGEIPEISVIPTTRVCVVSDMAREGHQKKTLGTPRC